jgi:predicted adenine nucleotide alpha hydrolase (AANH) superfamily ATPase
MAIFNGSEFTKSFGIDFYDENFKESEFFEESKNSLELLFKGFSCESIIIPRFNETVESIKENFDVVILLCNFRYIPTIFECQSREVYFKFIGSTSYKN